MLVALADRSRPEVVADSRRLIAHLPEQLRRSLTWDQGNELAAHAAFGSPTESRSTSATRTAPGSAARTRTPTACSASTSPREPTSPPHPGRTRRRRRRTQRPPPQTLGWMTPAEALDEALR